MELYSVTISYIRWCPRLHLKSTQYKQVPSKKKKREREKKGIKEFRRNEKKRETKEKDRMKSWRRRKRDGKILCGRKWKR